MNNELKEMYENVLAEKFSETGAAEKIQKWLKKNNVVVISQDFTNGFVNAKSLQYTQYLQLVQWCLDNNVIVIDKKFSDEIKNYFIKLKWSK